jgi:hypothetical protein
LERYVFERPVLERTVLERTVFERTVFERTVFERTVFERTVFERTVFELPACVSNIFLTGGQCTACTSSKFVQRPVYWAELEYIEQHSQKIQTKDLGI